MGEQSRLRDGERGAALVEFAISLPLLAMLIFGIVSSAMAFGHQLSLTHSAREASRYAATLPVKNFVATETSTGKTAMHQWLETVGAQAIEDATGSLDDGLDGRAICVAYVHPDGTLATDRTTRLLWDSSGPGSPTQDATCFVDGRPAAERRVQVTVARGMDFSVLLFAMDVTLDSEAVSRYEAGLTG